MSRIALWFARVTIGGVQMPTFNRARRVLELLEKGHAVLLIKSWDTPGVLSAGRAVANAIEHPASMEWDSRPPAVERWTSRLEAEARRREWEAHRRPCPLDS